MAKSIKMQKMELRKRLREQATDMDKAYLSASNAAIEARLFALKQYHHAGNIFAYISRGTEPLTHSIIKKSLAQGKRIAVPRCLKNGIMEARYIDGLDGLEPNKWGILEPDEAFELAEPQLFDLVIVPCMAADRRRYRLGYGGGFYDRYLLRTGCTTVCLCRDRTLLDELPTEPFDLVIDMVITDSGIIM